jgi:hypothetical protein
MQLYQIFRKLLPSISSLKLSTIYESSSLIFHNRYFTREYKHKSTSNDIWKKLNIEVMRDELEIIGLQKNK